MNASRKAWQKDRAAQAPGWLVAVAGAAVLSATVLVPAHESLRNAEWRRGVMLAQTLHLESLAERYGDFHEALTAGEPVLLERLAFAQLRLRPRDKHPVGWEGDSLPGGAVLAAHHPSLEDDADLHAWLSRPLPSVGHDLPAHRPTRSRLARLVAGPSRLGLVVAGGLLLLGGLLWTPTTSAERRAAVRAHAGG